MEKRLVRNIRLFYLFQLLREPLFWGAIIITFIQRVSGMSLQEIYLMESLCISVSILLQVPTGALADLVGRRRLMIIGYILLMADVGIFAMAGSRLVIWLSNILFFAGYSMIAGADNAMLFDTLKLLGREKSYKKILGQTIAGRYLLTAVCSLITGYLAEYNLRLPMFLSLLPMILGLITIFCFYEPAINQTSTKKECWQLIKTSLISVANHGRIKWLIAFIALTSVIGKLWFFTYNPYFEKVGLSLRYYGWLFLALNIVAAASSFYADAVSRKLGNLWSIILIIFCQSVPIILMGVFLRKEAATMVILQNFVRGYFSPFLDNFLNHYLDSKNRATVLSIKSGVTDFAHLVFLAAFAGVLSICALAQSLIWLGIFSLIAGAILIATYLKIFKVRE